MASAADLLKQEEAQFIEPGSIQEQRANFKPEPSNVDKLVDFMRNQSSKSLVELKREMQQNVYGQKDKPKFEINPQPAPGSAKSALPATRAVVVQETSLGDLTQPLAKRPSRFDKVEKGRRRPVDGGAVTRETAPTKGQRATGDVDAGGAA